MPPKIKIVTGKIHSGKTTSLFKFISEHKNTDGILAPIVNDKRRLYHISTKTIKNFETSERSTDIVSVGKYFFLNESINWANKKLIDSLNSSVKYLIIDEIGKLELRGEGLHKSTQEILKEINISNKILILVVRDYLLDEVLKYYNISEKEYEVLVL